MSRRSAEAAAELLCLECMRRGGRTRHGGSCVEPNQGGMKAVRAWHALRQRKARTK